jgi:hypothetical protein
VKASGGGTFVLVEDDGEVASGPYHYEADAKHPSEHWNYSEQEKRCGVRAQVLDSGRHFVLVEPYEDTVSGAYAYKDFLGQRGHTSGEQVPLPTQPQHQPLGEGIRWWNIRADG